jgi:hypothetical protein
MIIIQRRTYLADRTTGQLEIAGEILGSTLEDIGRPAGIKIPKETCLPEGDYLARITQSQRFGRPMILLFTDPKTLACTHGGIRFDGIRVHAGSTTAHTEGCVLYKGDLAALEKLIAGSSDPVTWRITR